MSSCVGWHGCGWVNSLQAHLGKTDLGTIDAKMEVVSQSLRLSLSRDPRELEKTYSFSALKLLLWVSLIVGARCQLTDLFPAQFELSSLDGTNGFILKGEKAGDRSGYSVSSAGDVNGDGLDDILIGAYNASPSGKLNAGKSYVVFGNRNIVNGGVFDLSSLNGTNGFIMNGEAADDRSGFSVSSAGDVNGDGISDLLIGAYSASLSGRTDAGKSYVVYGSRSFVNGGILELLSLNGTNGFILNGEAAFDRSGVSISSAGDVNGDGLDDIVIGSWRASPSGRINAGKSYVVYGSRNIVSGGVLELSSLNGTNGFILNGVIKDDRSSISVSSAGDVNVDGLNDLVIGASYASPSGRKNAGKSYVMYGSRSIVSGGILELSSINGTNGFFLNGEAAGDYSGRSVSSAGDVNGDGIDDFVIGAYGADPSNRTAAGKTYVVYGGHKNMSDGVLELSSFENINGFILYGEAVSDISGVSVSTAGDVNGDGLSDLIIGAYRASPSGKFLAGKSYVVYGSRRIVSGGVLELSRLDGINGFILNGEAEDDISGVSVSTAGDVNGDGIDDLVIGACNTLSNNRTEAGKSYVIFGRNLNTQILTLPPYMETTSLSLTTNITTLPLFRSFQPTETSSQIESSLSSSQQLRTSTGSLQSLTKDQFPLIVGIAAAVAALVCSIFSGGFFYFKRLRKVKEEDGSSKEMDGTSYGYVSAKDEPIDRASVKSDYNYNQFPGKQRSHYDPWSSEPEPNDPNHYTSIDKVEQDHADYVEDKMEKAHVHYAEIRH